MAARLPGAWRRGLPENRGRSATHTAVLASHPGPREVEREEAFEQLIVGDVGGPAVGGQRGLVEAGVDVA